MVKVITSLSYRVRRLLRSCFIASEGRWDPKVGKPTAEKLRELELFDVARDLWE
jgi:hypothetical protein